MKRLISLICVLALCFCMNFIPTKKAHADALSIGMVSAASYALFNDWGISFTSYGATAEGMSTVMNNRVSNYINTHGGSLTNLFGSEVLRVSLGKLIVPQLLYNGIKDFAEYLIDNYDDVLSNGSYGDTEIGNIYTVSVDINPDGASVLFTEYGDGTSYNVAGYKKINVYNKGVSTANQTLDTYYSAFTGSWGLIIDGNYLRVKAERLLRNGSTSWNQYTFDYISSIDNKLNWDTEDYIEPAVLNPDKEWSGTIGGQAVPDTNLDQLIGEIFEEVADNNLDVDGEIIDVPDPPSPAPTPVIDVLDGINTQIGQLDGIGNDIGNIADNLDDVGALQEEAVDALEGIQEGIDTQTGILGGINTKAGSINQTLTDTQDIVNDISDTLTDALDVPSAQESSDYKFDLSTLFPFCIPFDIARMLRAFDGAAAAPHFQIPIVISSIGFSYTLDLDFQIFDPVAAVLRQVELIAFAIALAYATSKVIRW